MALDPRNSVSRGQRLSVSADQINYLNRLMRGSKGLSGGPLSPGFSAPYTSVLATNSTGSTLERWSVMEITGLRVEPTSSDTDAATQQFFEMPVLTGGAVEDRTSNPCIAIEPIKAGEIGRVAIAGVVQVKATELDKIRGAVRVLWEDTDWALVAIGNSSVTLAKTTSTWPKDSTAEVQLVYLDDCESASPGEETIEAINLLYPVSAKSRVVISQAANGCSYLIAAESCGDPSPSMACCSPAIGGENLSMLSGYDSSKRQLLMHDGGCLRWIDTYACPTD